MYSRLIKYNNMPNFPSFILTGETKNLSDAPLEVKPLNLLPLIELMRQEGKTAGSPSTSKKSGGDNDPKIEGRIGAVNQYMSSINSIQSKMNKGLDLYGATFTSLPEYSSLVRQLDAAESPERLNIISRETKNLDQYKANTKDKGSLYDVSALMKGFGIQKVSDWTEQLEYGKTDALGGKGGTFIQGFDFNPTLTTSGEATTKLKEYFSGAGSYSLAGESTKFIEDAVGHAVGIMTITQKNSYERNYGGDLRGGEKKWGLDYKYDQLQEQIIGKYIKTGEVDKDKKEIISVIENQIDLSNPIANGLLQGFIQKTDGLSEYVTKEGLFKSTEAASKFFNDYKRYVSDNINNEFNAAKTKKDNSGESKSFNEFSETAYNNKKESDMYNAAQLESTMSIDDDNNIGVDFDSFARTSGLFSGTPFGDALNLPKPTMTDDEKNALFQGQESPFSLSTANGKTYVTLNNNYNDKKYKEYLQKQYPNNWQQLYDKAQLKKQELYAQVSNGNGDLYTTRRDISTTVIPATGLGDSWWNLVNSDSYVGQSAENIGRNLIGMIGTTPFNLSDLGKDLTYAGVEGGIVYVPNTVPNNLYTIIKEQNGKLKLYQHTSPEWNKLSDAKKTELYSLSMEQAKSDSRVGTKFLNADGTLANKISKSTLPADSWEQRYLATIANDPNVGENFIYAAPVAPMQTAKFEGKKDDIIKALEKITVNVEMPSAYAKDERYKKEYLQTPAIVDYSSVPDGRGLFFNTQIQKADDIIKTNKLTGKKAEEFKKYYDQIISSSANKSQKETLVKDALIKTKIEYKGGFNFNSQNVILTPVKVAEDGKINPFAQKFVSIANKPSASDKNVTTDVLYIQTDVTPIVSQSATNRNNIMSTQINISNKLIGNNPATTTNPYNNVGIKKQ